MAKLKRYVLTNKKEIVTTSKRMFVEDNGLLVVKRFNGFSEYGKVIKTSDNILDLVEVGDLVSVLLTSDLTYYKMEVIEFYENVIKLSNTALEMDRFNGEYVTLNGNLKVCNAIWKLQHNGDYKRYKV